MAFRSKGRSPGRRPPRGRSRRSGRRGPHKRVVSQHTSVPTSRNAFAETRAWLLKTHGPVCAYCGRTTSARTMTLDHVTPRKGQSAYDRRDNLVLACKRCNTAKADKPFMVYLLAQRSRAEHLLRYGAHLSQGILELLRHMVGDQVPEPSAPVSGSHPRKPPQKRPTRHVYGSADDEESPYKDHDSPYRRTA